MKPLFLALALLLSISIEAQTKLDRFEKISVFGNIELILVKGDEYSYTAHEHSEDLKIRVVEGKLKIGHKQNQRMWEDKTVVEVTFVNLKSLDASAGATVEYESELEAGDIFLSADTGAFIYLNLKAGSIEAMTGEGGTMTLKGTCRTLEAKSSTGAVFKASRLEAETVYARANTGGRLAVHAVERLEASASLGGTITYDGDPNIVRINENTGGTVRG